MATINIGNLAFTHKGDYDGSTAYAKNDVVYYSTNGNAYIAKQATTGNVPTNATYWNQFSQGSGGIWNGGLALGSAGQAVRVNSAANALEFYTPSAGGAISTHFSTFAGSFNTNSNSYQTIGSGISLTMTPASTTSKILLLSSLNVYGDYAHLTYFRGSTNLATDKVSTTNRIIHNSTNWSNSSMSYIDQPNTTSSITYEIKIKASSSSSVYVGDGNQILNTFLAIEL